MPKAIHINVPKPCHENWHSMTPKEQGRFCGACKKVVVDFSVMSDKEMLDYFTKAAGQPVCGRFANDQLNRRIEPATSKRRLYMPYVWNLLLVTGLFFESCKNATTGEPQVCEKPVVQKPEPTKDTVVVAEDTVQPVPPAETKDEIRYKISDLPMEGIVYSLPDSIQTAIANGFVTMGFCVTHEPGERYTDAFPVWINLRNIFNKEK